MRLIRRVGSEFFWTGLQDYRIHRIFWVCSALSAPFGFIAGASRVSQGLWRLSFFTPEDFPKPNKSLPFQAYSRPETTLQNITSSDLEVYLLYGYVKLMKCRQTILVFLVLVAWKAVRMDWIVECESASADFHPSVSVERFTDSYTPPVSAFWDPPTPEKLTGRATSSWIDPKFFAGGGSYGPTSDPVLRVNWQLALAKIASVFVAVLLFLRVAQAIRRS